MFLSGCLGHADQVAAVTELIRAQADDSTTVEAKVVAFSRASAELLNAGRYELADALLADIAAIATVHAITDPVVLARTHDARARRALVLGDLGEFLRLNVAALEGFERGGHLRLACNLRVSVGYAHLQLGAYVEAEGMLREALIEADRLGLSGVSPSAKENLGMALAGQERWGEARAVAAEAVEAFRAQGHRRMEAGALIYLALMLGMSGSSAPRRSEIRSCAGASSSASPRTRAPSTAPASGPARCCPRAAARRPDAFFSRQHVPIA